MVDREFTEVDLRQRLEDASDFLLPEVGFAVATPHSMQNFAPPGSGLPQLPQLTVNGAPHSTQNFGLSGFS
jgi:hypothetical protein